MQKEEKRKSRSMLAMSSFNVSNTNSLITPSKNISIDIRVKAFEYIRLYKNQGANHLPEF